MRQLAKAVHHRVVMHDHQGLVLTDAWDGLLDFFRQVELAALPVAWQILSAALDTAIVSNETGTADADDGRKLQVALVRGLDQVLQHLGEFADGIVPIQAVFVTMTPELHIVDASF